MASRRSSISIVRQVVRSASVHPEILLPLHTNCGTHDFEQEDATWEGHAEDGLHQVDIVDLVQVLERRSLGQCGVVGTGNLLNQCALLGQFLLSFFLRHDRNLGREWIGPTNLMERIDV